MTKEEAKQFGLLLLHGIEERNTGKYAENVKLAIEALTEPSLPSNLDEAAVSAHIKMEEDGEEMTFLNTFKAGAEWMAEQGESFETEIINVGVLSLPELKIQAGDRVIVQIRKK